MLRQYLTEHVVINVEEVERFIRVLVAATRPEEGKQWFAKRLRSLILNDAAYLDVEDEDLIPADAPGYVRNAVARGEPVYRFYSDKVRVHQLMDTCTHITHFFNNLSDVAERRPENPVQVEDNREAKKLLSKLQKMTFDQVLKADEEWGKRAGSRVAGLTKEGCEVIYQWSDGFYAVRFTDRATMMRDGQDLQNCLRTGTYWDSVKNGSQWVVAIRKPNDEAVIGMRWRMPGLTDINDGSDYALAVMNGHFPKREGMSILECKGKNNRAANPQYVPYVVDLLHHFGIKNMIGDLESAGISVNNGRYGTFRDIASHRTVGNVQIWTTDSRFEIQVGRSAMLSGSFSTVAGARIISDIEIGSTCSGPMASKALNAMGIPASARPRTKLRERGVFAGDRGYGTAKDIGEELGTYGEDMDVTVYRVEAQGDEGGAASYLVFEKPDHPTILVFTSRKGSSDVVASLNFDLYDYLGAAGLFRVLNDAGVVGSEVFDNSHALPYGYVRTPSGYQRVDSAAKNIGTVDGKTVWEVEHRGASHKQWGLWLAETGNGSLPYDWYRKKRGVMTVAPGPGSDYLHMRRVVRFLCRKYTFSNIEGFSPEACGVLHVEGKASSGDRLISTPQAFIEEMENLGGDKAPWGPPFQRSQNDLDDYIRNGGFDQLTLADARRLFKALKPGKETFRTSEGTEYTVYAVGLKKVCLYPANMLFYFERVFAKWPELDKRTDAERTRVINAVRHHVDENKDKCIFTWDQRSEIVAGFGTDIRRHITRCNDAAAAAAKAAASQAPENATISDRFQALNSLRKLKR